MKQQFTKAYRQIRRSRRGVINIKTIRDRYSDFADKYPMQMKAIECLEAKESLCYLKQIVYESRVFAGLWAM